MPIKIQKELPAFKVLSDENIFVNTEKQKNEKNAYHRNDRFYHFTPSLRL